MIQQCSNEEYSVNLEEKMYQWMFAYTTSCYTSAWRTASNRRIYYATPQSVVSECAVKEAVHFFSPRKQQYALITRTKVVLISWQSLSWTEYRHPLEPKVHYCAHKSVSLSLGQKTVYTYWL